MNRPRWSREQVLAAIKGSMGIVSKIAKALDECGWHTAQRYVNRWEETRRAYADESERALDLSESKLLVAVNAGDGPMIRFHLATKGKHRGFTERTEIVGADGAPVEVKHGFTDAAVADLLSILAGLGALQPSTEEGSDAKTE